MKLHSIISKICEIKNVIPGKIVGQMSHFPNLQAESANI